MTISAYILTKSSTNSNMPLFHLGIFIPILYILKYVNKHPNDHNINNLSNYENIITSLTSKIRIEDKGVEINKTIILSKIPKIR